MRLVLVACLALLALPAAAQTAPDDKAILQARSDLLSGRVDSALPVLEAAAQAGDARAQYLFGSIWGYGDTGTVDIQEALRWYQMAADQGYPVAIHEIGLTYRYGAEGVAPDPVRALAEFQRAADLEYGGALTELGIMYRDGIGVPVDLELSRLYLELGVARGNADAASVLGWAYQNGLGVTADDAEARRLYQISASQGAINGLVNLGVYAENGWGGPQDIELAAESYRAAMEQGYALAGLNMGYLIANNPDLGTSVDAAAHCLWAQNHATILLEGDAAISCPDLVDGLSPVDFKAADKASQRLIAAQ